MKSTKPDPGMDLVKKKCKPCEGGIPVLTHEEVLEYKRYVSNTWEVIEDKKIFARFSFVNFRHTMDFVNKVAELAEQEGHHPVLHVYYGRADIEIWAHAIDGLS